MVFDNEIKYIQFYINGNKQNEKLSVVEINNKNLFKDNEPVNNGVYDIHMGTTDNKLRCHTCYHSKKDCVGHFGHIESPYPFVNPLFRREVIKWVRAVCAHCGLPVLGTKIELNTGKSNYLNEYVKKVKLSNKKIKCHYCSKDHKILEKDAKNSFRFLYKDDNDTETRVYNNDIENIVMKITDETVVKMGRSIEAHPNRLLLRILAVPPVALRPDIKKMNSNQSNINDLTAIIKNIIIFISKLPKIMDHKSIEDNIKQLDLIEMHYFSLIKDLPAGSTMLQSTSSKLQLVSLMSRHTGKTGRIRGNIMGKRVTNMARSVITGDNYIHIDEVGIPIIIAKNIQIPEIVQDYNKEKLLIYFNNKSDHYPGCTKIVKKSNGREYDINYIGKNNNIILENGDTIYRDLIDGDIVALNRAPSLLFSSISALRVRILYDGNSIRLSPNIVDSLFGGDFDGDAMNVIFVLGIKARNECKVLTDVKRWFISYKDGTPAVGIYHDGLNGISEFTRDNVMISKLDAMQFLSTIDDITDIDYDKLKEVNNSRDVISLLLPKFNYTKYASHYNPNLKDIIDYKENEIKIEIVHGQVISGRFDKKIVGQNVDDSIFHHIHHEYGAKKTLNLIRDIQQVTTSYQMHEGFTVHYDDIVIDKSAITLINDKINDILKQAETITEKLKNGHYVPPINMTLKNYYEQMLISVLNLGDDFLRPVLMNIDVENNNLYKLISTGTKGKYLNLMQISSSIGPTSIGGDLMAQNFAYGRTLPYFERFNSNPQSRGFVIDSYSDGVRNVSYIFQSMEARYSIINKALSTAKTGYQNRKSIKNLESLVVDNLRKTAKFNRIVQILYGEDGIDIRFVENVKFNKILDSNKEFEDTYKCDIKKLNKIFQNKEIEIMLEKEYKDILESRDMYRNIFMSVEQANSKSRLITNSIKLPININKIVDDVVYDHRLNKENFIIDPIKSLDKVNELYNELLYCHYNEIQLHKKVSIPNFIQKSFTLLFISIKLCLSMSNIVKHNLSLAMLENIKLRALEKYKNALIEPGLMVGIISAQSISEPSTQYILDSQHRSGTSGTSVDFLVRSKEIYGAKPTEKMEDPNLLITIKDKYATDQLSIQRIANHIEMLKFKIFIQDKCSLFFEKYKHIVHPDYIHENDMIKLFEKHNPNLKVPNDLINFCIRVPINKEKLIEKNIALEEICFKLQETYPFLFIVNTSENADTIILRLYIRSMFFKKSKETQINQIVKFIKIKLNETVIRGINGIISTNTENNIARSYIDETGTIKNKILPIITTSGTNLDTIFENDFIDPYNTFSNSIIEIQETLGIEAARTMIINEIRNMIPTVNIRHYMMYADEMTSTGVVTAIEKSGIDKRNPNDVLLSMSNSHPVQIGESAAINNIKTNVNQSLSASLMTGRVPKFGSLYNKAIYNETFISENN